MTKAFRILCLIALLAFSFVAVNIDSWVGHRTPEAMESVVFVEAELEVEVGPGLYGDETSKSLNPPPVKTTVAHASGTGFVVDGVLITARHIVTPPGNSRLLEVRVSTRRGQCAKAEVVRSDEKYDLMELRLLSPLDIPSLRLAKSVPVVDEPIVQLGNPARIRFVTTRGTIVGFDRSIGYNIAVVDTFGGNSGGPDLNSRGEVIGMCHIGIVGTRFTGIGTLAQLHAFLYPDSIR